MTNTLNQPAMRKPLRVMPAIVIAILQILVIVIATTGVFWADQPVALGGGAICALLTLIWWLLFSRAPWLERIGAIALMAVALQVMVLLVDPSISGGAQGMLGYILGLPYLTLALIMWAVVSRSSRAGARRAGLVAAMVLGCVPLTLLRTEGIMGANFLMHWRWTPTPEELLLAQNDEPKPVPPPAAAPAEVPKEPVAATSEKPVVPVPAVVPVTETAKPAPATIEKPSAWPGFRGPNRDSVVRGIQIKTDWSTAPPAEMWRRPIGPGWSSFSIRGDVLYTQEQRGDDEVVAAYRVSTGEPVWRHRDPIRFYESNGGAGPRATPTIHNGRVYSHGATGMLNALDADTGKLIWAHNTSADTGREIPLWGIASSPLVVGDVVIVSVAGTMTAYDLDTGKARWTGPVHGGSYSSPHLIIADGVTQVVNLSAPGAVAVNPADGKLLWEHRWEGGAIVQPAITAEGDILINAMGGTGGMGTRRLAITRGSSGWTAEEKWTSNGLKPYFNDLVLHKGHAFGFDGSILSCIDLADGKRKWKGGRYGQGQMLLLADQDLLLILSEDGELALVSATPDQYREVAKFRALDAKTWNHPVVVGDILLVRNGEEMAAFRLSLDRPATPTAVP